MDFGLHFEVHFREKAKKNDAENEAEFGDGKKAKKERKGVNVGMTAGVPASGARRPGASNPERIRRSGQNRPVKVLNTPDPEGAADLKAQAPLPPAPQS